MHRSPIGHCLNGIDRQVNQRLNDPVRYNLNRREIGGYLDRNLERCRQQRLFEQRQCALHQVVDRSRPCSILSRLSEPQHLFGDLGQVLDLLLTETQVLLMFNWLHIRL